MGTGFAKKKKQAKAMQQQFSQMQSQLQSLEITGSAGNGLVTIVLNGDNEIKQLKINPQCVDPEDVEGLEDLIKAAYKDANEKVKKESMKNLPSQLPGGMPDLSAFGF
jgi:DNA-binding YbaB/EbfC family protein